MVNKYGLKMSLCMVPWNDVVVEKRAPWKEVIDFCVDIAN